MGIHPVLGGGRKRHALLSLKTIAVAVCLLKLLAIAATNIGDSRLSSSNSERATGLCRHATNMNASILKVRWDNSFHDISCEETVCSLTLVQMFNLEILELQAGNAPVGKNLNTS